MVSSQRSTEDHLDELIELIRSSAAASGARQDFVGLVRLLEQVLKPKAPVGGEGPFSDEGIVFSHRPDFSFSPSEVNEVRPQASGAGVQVESSFMGLTGAVSPIPNFLSEDSLGDGEGSSVLREFLDLFHHRLHSLLFRAAKRCDWPGAYDSQAGDLWSQRVLSLCGVPDDVQRRLRHLSQNQLLRLSPLLGSGIRSEGVLKQALNEVLGDELAGASIEVEQFAGGWTALHDAQQMRLGEQNCRLGEDAVVGTRCFDRAGKVSLVFKNVDERHHQKFLPGGASHPLIQEVLDLFSSDLLDCELSIELGGESVGGFTLGVSEEDKTVSKGLTKSALGVNTWLPMPGGQSKRIRANLGKQAHA